MKMSISPLLASPPSEPMVKHLFGLAKTTAGFRYRNCKTCEVEDPIEDLARTHSQLRRYAKALDELITNELLNPHRTISVWKLEQLQWEYDRISSCVVHLGLQAKAMLALYPGLINHDGFMEIIHS